MAWRRIQAGEQNPAARVDGERKGGKVVRETQSRPCSFGRLENPSTRLLAATARRGGVAGELLAPLLLSWNQTQSKLAVQPEAAERVVLIGPCGRAAVHGMPALISAVGCLKRLTVVTGWLVEGRQGMRRAWGGSIVASLEYVCIINAATGQGDPPPPGP